VSEGRAKEFATHGRTGDVPDPQATSTFLRSKLDWTQPDREPHAAMLAWYRELLTLRRARPELTDPRLDRVRVTYDEDARWLVVHRGRLRIAVNLAPAPARVPLGASGGAVLAASVKPVSIERDVMSLPPASFAVAATS
jgi:maltooligosyltrehalose trehalohydrolase